MKHAHEPITLDALRALIESKMEPSEPVMSIIAILDSMPGKPVTEKTIAKMRESIGDESISLRRAYGMAHIQWGGYERSGGKTGGSLHIAYREKGITADPAFVREHNICYLGAREKRNAQREALLNAPEEKARLVELKEALNAFNAAREKLTELFAYGEPCSVIQHEAQKLAGIERL